MMKTIINFNISCNGINLPFEFYSIDYILEELNKNKELFGMITKIEDATKSKIRKFPYKKFSRHFAYIKFFNYKGELYGIVGGKTNYTYPDLSFDKKKDKLDNRYSRNFLSELSKSEDDVYSTTIIIINHIPSNSEETDKQAALFLECYLQRKFNLFNS